MHFSNAHSGLSTAGCVEPGGNEINPGTTNERPAQTDALASEKEALFQQLNQLNLIGILSASEQETLNEMIQDSTISVSAFAQNVLLQTGTLNDEGAQLLEALAASEAAGEPINTNAIAEHVASTREGIKDLTERMLANPDLNLTDAQTQTLGALGFGSGSTVDIAQFLMAVFPSSTVPELPEAIPSFGDSIEQTDISVDRLAYMVEAVEDYRSDRLALAAKVPQFYALIFGLPELKDPAQADDAFGLESLQGITVNNASALAENPELNQLIGMIEGHASDREIAEYALKITGLDQRPDLQAELMNLSDTSSDLFALESFFQKLSQDVQERSGSVMSTFLGGPTTGQGSPLTPRISEAELRELLGMLDLTGASDFEIAQYFVKAVDMENVPAIKEAMAQLYLNPAEYNLEHVLDVAKAVDTERNQAFGQFLQQLQPILSHDQAVSLHKAFTSGQDSADIAQQVLSMVGASDTTWGQSLISKIRANSSTSDVLFADAFSLESLASQVVGWQQRKEGVVAAILESSTGSKMSAAEVDTLNQMVKAGAPLSEIGEFLVDAFSAGDNSDVAKALQTLSYTPHEMTAFRDLVSAILENDKSQSASVAALSLAPISGQMLSVRGMLQPV